MIKAVEGSVQIEGDINTVLAEGTLIAMHCVRIAVDHMGMPETEAIDAFKSALDEGLRHLGLDALRAGNRTPEGE